MERELADAIGELEVGGDLAVGGGVALGEGGERDAASRSIASGQRRLRAATKREAVSLSGVRRVVTTGQLGSSITSP